MRIVQAESTEYPLLLDTESSETTIFERQDIVEVEREGQTYYRYTEYQYEVKEWLQLNVPDLTRNIALSADKTQISADGIDVATITAVIPVDAEYCFITVNGPPAEKATVIGGQVVREFAAETPGLYKVEFFAGNKTASMIIEVV